MANFFVGNPEFKKGDKVVSLVIHPPEIKSGTKATVVSPRNGLLYAVQLPNGELHRWLAWFELEAVNQKLECCPLPKEGEYARILNDKGHHMIRKGMVVKVVKVIQTPFYDLILENGKYHRWLAEFEIIHLI